MKNIQQIFENTELFEIYACILITLINKNEQEYYFRLKNLLIKNLKLFNRMEKYSLLVTLGTCTSLKAETDALLSKYCALADKIYADVFEKLK